MEIIFKIKDKTGRLIYLTRERYKHITSLHPNMVGKIEDIKQTLEKPSLIVPHKYSSNMRNYYTYYKDKQRYMLVSVKYLNHKGFIATAFITRKIKRR